MPGSAKIKIQLTEVGGGKEKYKRGRRKVKSTNILILPHR